MFRKTISRARRLLGGPRLLLREAQATWSGYRHWGRDTKWPPAANGSKSPSPAPNALSEFFASRKEGHGIWKWNHYFPIYDRHFSRFRGQKVNILEIGIYSGGSLEMWRDYFGSQCHVYGVDLEPACKAYESDSVSVFIGDQADRAFWSDFKSKVTSVDIVIDDGGHAPHQQVATLEELLPHIRPGGVYLCEDVHGKFNEFASYAFGLVQNMNAFERSVHNVDDMERRLVCPASPLQAAVRSVHFYPYVIVIERTDGPVLEFVAPKHGSQWAPFLK